jgi:hypothetical protein
MDKVTFCLSKSWSRAPVIRKAVHEKGTFSAFSALFSANHPPWNPGDENYPIKSAILQCRVLHSLGTFHGRPPKLLIMAKGS